MIIIFNNGFKLNKESFTLPKSSFESLAAFSCLLAFKLAVGVEIKLLIFDNVVTSDITFLSSSQVGLDTFRVVTQSSQKLFP